MKVYAVANRKGGVGKTTTAATMAGILSSKGKVLLIDLDAQCNLTLNMGADTDRPTIFGVLTGEAKIADTIQHLGAIDFISSSKALSTADILFNGRTGREYALKEALEELSGYDYVIIDTPPALGILVVNALTACNELVIPVQADLFSIQACKEIITEVVRPVKKYSNPNIKVAGILLTRYSPRTLMNKQAAEMIGELAESLGTKVFKNTIREAVAVREAQYMQKTLPEYDPKANVTTDYYSFVEELTGE